jgi:hypothetical protein
MDFLTEQYTSSRTDSHTTGGTPVSTKEAAQASTLFHFLHRNRFRQTTPRLFIVTVFS